MSSSRHLISSGFAVSGFRLAGMILGMGLLLAGCASTPSATDSRVQTRPAAYAGLENQVVAVLVEINPALLVRHRLLGYELASGLSQRLAGHLNQAQIIEPQEVMEFQRANAFWPSMTDSELATHLKSGRLVIIELTGFELIESAPPFRPWGRIEGAISVAEADKPGTTRRVFSHPLNLQYPPNGPLDVQNAHPPSLRLALIDRFCEEAARLFYDHEVLP